MKKKHNFGPRPQELFDLHLHWVPNGKHFYKDIWTYVQIQGYSSPYLQF